MDDIANKIKHLRIENNVSQEELASAIQVSRQTISKWENGFVSPGIDNLIALCNYFKVDLNYFANAETAVAKPDEKVEKKVPSTRSVVADWLFPVMLVFFSLIDVVLGIVVVAFGCTYFPTIGLEDVVMTFPVDLNMFIVALFFFLVFLGLTIFTIVKFVKYKRSLKGERKPK